MSVARKIIKWTLAILLAAAFLTVGLAKLTPTVHAPTYKLLSTHFDALVKNKISPYNATKWSGEALRVAIGVVEVIFASLALCPYYTRLSAFVFSTMASMALYNTVQLKETANLVPISVLLALSVVLFLVSGDAVAKTVKVEKKKTN